MIGNDMRTKKAPALPPESEESLQAKVMGAAKAFGWRAVHFRPARTSKGWRTAFTGDPGFPDCVLVRRGRLVFAELKREDREPTEDQWQWITALESPDLDVEVYVWRPADWDEIVRILR
jgi:hypothetical protein